MAELIYSNDQREKDFKYFLNKYDDIYEKYGHCYVAIRFEEIIGVFEDEKSAIDITSSQFKFGEFIIQECNGDESAYTNYMMTVGLIQI